MASYGPGETTQARVQLRRECGARVGDDGAVLPVVLAFITVIGVIVGALLGQAAVNFNATSALEGRRDRVFAADAGLEWVFARSATIAPAIVPAIEDCNDEALELNGTQVEVCWSGTPDEFTVVSTATDTDDGSASTATAVIVKTATAYVPREWHTASD